MHLKSEGQGKMQNEIERNGVCCPVCFQYLLREETLHDHLNAHPKHDVIDALIKLKDAYKPNSAESSSGRSTSSFTESSSSVETSETNSEMVIAPVVSIYDNDEPEPGNSAGVVVESTSAVTPSYTSASHLVPYPQILTGPSPVAHFIHVPVVTSAVQNVVTTAPAQAPVMLYSHFMCPESSQSASTSASDGSNSAHHLQILSNNNMMRTPYSIIQSRPQASPLPVPQPQSGVKTGGPSGHIVFMSSSQGISQLGSNDQNSEAGGNPPSTEDCDTPFFIELPENGEEEEEDSREEYECTEKCPIVNETDRENECNSTPTQELEIILPDCPPNLLHERRTSQEREMLSPPKKRRCPEWKELGSPGSHSTGWNTLGSPSAHSTCSVEGVLRVRSDLNVSPTASPPSPLEPQEEIETLPIRLEETEKDELKSALEFYTDSNIHTTMNKALCDQTEESYNAIQSEPVLTESTADEAAQTTVPLELMARCDNVPCTKEVDFRDDCSLGRPDSGPPSPYQKSLDSPSTPLNIQTDETMPPRGELSEQESMGGNSSSMWSVPAYHTFREWPSPVVSYDLTARESWPGSDLSDSEGNANAADNHQPQCFTTAPSFSNTLHPFMKINSSEGESPFSSHLQSQNYLEGPEGNKNPINNAVVEGAKGPSKTTPNANTSTTRVRKTPAKPRVYRCKECSTVFSTLKLRRLHPCEQMKNSDNSTSVTVMRMNSDIKGTNENILASGSSSIDGELSAPPQPKRKCPRKPKATIKKEVIVDDQSSGQANFGVQYRISKTEPEDTAESRVNSQTLLDLPTSVPYESSTYEPTAAETTFVEVTLKHELQPTYPCQKCGQHFKTAKFLSQHLLSKHKGQKYQCATCGESFEKERGYLDHLMIHPLECQLCGKTFMRRKYLTLHMKWHMEVKPHKCETCGKSFVTKQKLDEHLNTHTGNAPIKCSHCDETFKRYSNLIQHRNRHHLHLKRKTRDHICHCGEVLSSKKKLEWHKEIHDQKPKSCQYCSEKFVHSVSLTRHVRRAHDRRYVPKKEREGENIECPICHLVFLKSSLATHIKIHSGERPFPCHICGKDFTTKWNLQHHRWTHASRSSKPFKCTLCKATFHKKQDYVAHMHSHRNVRPFTCNHCGCQFVRKYNCIRHMREHEEGKNFTCTICNKTFHRSYYLTDHMRVHNGTRPFTCHICGKASSSKSNHNKHVRIHHAREPQNTEI